MFNPFKYMGRKKKEEEVVVSETVVVEEAVATSERDEAFYKAHKGAREDVIYG